MRQMSRSQSPDWKPSSIRRRRRTHLLLRSLLVTFALPSVLLAADAIPAPGSKLSPPDGNKVITAADVTVERVGSSIPVSAIGEPVSAISLSQPRWVTGANGGYGVVDGQIMPVDPKGKPINFRVVLPANWARRAVQLGGGGMNGMIPNLTGGELAQGFATYGSDSGHQMGGFPGMGSGGTRGARGASGGPVGGFPGGPGGMTGGGMGQMGGFPGGGQGNRIWAD